MFRKSLFLVTILFSVPAFAQDNKLLVAASSSSETYSQMLGEIIKVCSSNDLTIEEVKVSGGATANLAALKNNKASAAFVHSDVIFVSAMADSEYKKLQTLVALYPEEIHVVAKRDSGVKTGGKFGFGAKDVTFRSLADLRGYKVAAAGGSALTAKLLTGQGEGGFSVVEKNNGKEVLAALDNGEVQAAVFVGGAPLKNIEELNDTYKLLPIPEAMASRLSTVYHGATINYSNMHSGPVKTLAPDAILLTRQYKSPRMVAPQRKFRECFYKSLDDLKETPNLHPKWQAVSESNHGSWDWYEIPGPSRK